MKFKNQVRAIIDKLGLTDKAKNKKLNAEENASIAMAYKEEYGNDMEEDAHAHKLVEGKAAAYDKIINAIPFSDEGTVSAENNEISSEGTPAATPDANASAVIESVNSLATTLKDTLAAAKADKPVETIKSIEVVGGAHTKTHLFGIANPMFDMSKRHNMMARLGKALAEDASKTEIDAFYSEFDKFAISLNQRYQELKGLGLITNNKLGTVDYSSMNDTELGTQFIVRRQDALISRIVMLPSLNHIFPIRSNIQDGEVITSAFFDEFSQGYQIGQISKGGFKLEPEKAKVHDVMFKYNIPSFKWIETSYLGYLNTSGSDPVKWSMIEWLILEISRKLQNERNTRAIKGYRVEPITGSSLPANFSATGLIHRLISYVEDFRVLPFKGSDYIYNSSSDIGDVLQAFAAQLSAVLDNSENYVIYANKKHEPWFKGWYRTNYGTEANYSGVDMAVPDYENKIAWVPNMGNSKFLIASLPGNLMQLENVPGEMSKIAFAQFMETVWGWSVWKEGFAASFAGKKFDSASDLAADQGASQIVFMNWPETAVAADATTINVSSSSAPDGLFKTGTNTATTTAITDLTNAKQGNIYRIEIGVATKASSIAKSGKFANIKSAWSPTAAGEYIKVYFDGTNFQEVERG